jgi:hypothetical protein
MDQESTPPTPEASQEEPQVEGQEPAAPADPAEGDDQKSTSRVFAEKYVRELRREAADARKRAGEAEARLKELADRDKTETEKLAERATTAEARAQEAESRLLRYEVAEARGLDLKAAAFLAGSTREEIEARADELGELLAEKGKPQTLPLDGGARVTPEKRGSPEEEHNDLLLRALGRKS